MTDPNYTALLLIVDRSGSMADIKSDMEGGLTSLLNEQKALPGLLTVDLYTFDTAIDHVHALEAPDKVAVVIEPRGGTALYDAIGLGVTEFGQVLAAMPEHARPDTVQVIVVTDGYENSSREYSLRRVRELIVQQKDHYKWDFVFLGANQDAVLSGVELGFDAGSSMSFNPDADGVDATSRNMNRYMTDVRLKQKKLFLAEERISSLKAERDELRRQQAEAQAAQAAQADAAGNNSPTPDSDNSGEDEQPKSA
jgi:hypothetical protein